MENKTTTLLNELEPLLVRYQRDSTDDSVVQDVVQVLQQQQQQQQQQSQEDDDDDDDDNDAETETTALLRHILDCAVAAVDEGGKSSSSSPSAEAARALIRLVVQVTGQLLLLSSQNDNNSNETTVQSVLERLIQLAACQSDKVRAAAVEQLGPLVEAVTRQMALSENDQQLHHWLDQLQQTVVAAVTDKAVAVRAAAVRAARSFGDRDPDVQQGLLWLLQHDPSAPNRGKAATAAAVNLSTITPLVCRVRDTHGAVRVAALQRLMEAPEATIVASASTSNVNNNSDNNEDDDDDDEKQQKQQHQQQRPALLQTHHLVAILRAGCDTDRCPATRTATRQLLLQQWMPQCHCNPLRLLQLLRVSDHPDAATQVVEALLEAAAPDNASLLEEHWSQAEIAAFHEGLEKALDFSIQDLSFKYNNNDNAENNNSACDYPVERLFWARAVLASKHNHSFNGNNNTNTGKEQLFQKLVPDIPALVQVLEGFVTQLVQTLAADSDGDSNNDNEDATEEKEETLVCLCTQLLQLATLQASTSLEEGSRRVLRDAMKRLLQTIWTPDALVEPCVQTLRAVVSEEPKFCDCVCEIVAHLDDTEQGQGEGQELQANFALRRLSILTVVLETVHQPSKRHVQQFAGAIVPLAKAVVVVQDDNNGDDDDDDDNNNNPLVSEAAISCLGKLGLFSSHATVRDDYMPIMLQTALDEHQERMEIRAQAMLAICDWSLLFANTADADASFRDLVGRLMSDESSSSPGTVSIAAEIAAKLLLAGKVCDSEWLAALVAIFFGDAAGSDDDDEPDDEDYDVTAVGNPVRLQQLLSVFFPTAVAQRKTLRDALTGCVGSLLPRACEDKKLKKSLPKMLDFVVSTAEQGRLAAGKQQQQQQQPKEAIDDDDAEEEKGEQEEDDKVMEPESSPGLLVAVQVATFLSERASDLNTTTLRALCKMVGTVDLVIEDELYEHLSLLKELLEELGNVIDDGTSLRSLTSITEQLDEVEMEEEVDDEDEDEEEQAALDEPSSPNTAKENKIVPPDSSDNGGEDSEEDDDDDTTTVKRGGRASGDSISSSSRRSSRPSRRRLRPTNEQ